MALFCNVHNLFVPLLTSSTDASSSRLPESKNGTAAQQQRRRQSSQQHQQQQQNLALFSSLLSPTNLLPLQACVDLYSLRHLVLAQSGLPDGPTWLRPQGWKLLLGLLGSDKREWSGEEQRKRNEYYSLLEELLPADTSDALGAEAEQTSCRASENRYDGLLTQIHLDLIRSRFSTSFSFFLQPVPPSASCPLAPLPDGFVELSITGSGFAGRKVAVKRTSNTHALRRRLRHLERQAHLGRGSGPRSSFQAQHSSHNQASETSLPPPIVLSPPSPSAPMPEPVTMSSPPQASTTSALMAQITSAAVSRQTLPAASGKSHSAGKEAEDRQTRETAEEPAISMPPTTAPEADDICRSNCLLRILFLHSLLNPTIGYVQGMVEVASVALWAEGCATGKPSQSYERVDEGYLSGSQRGEPETNPHFEADAFWTFSLLLGELRELWDFEGLDHSRAGLKVTNPRGVDSSSSPISARRRTEVGGMARALRRLGGRLRWADEELWRHLYRYGLSPSMPYYSFRWLATLLSTSLPLPSVLRIWDAIISEAPHGTTIEDVGCARVEFLLDVLTSLLISHRNPLFALMNQAAVRARREATSMADLTSFDKVDVERITATLTAEESFAACMTFLQDLPDDDIAPVLEHAQLLKQRRMAAEMTREGLPPDHEEEDNEEAIEGLHQGIARNIAAGQKALASFREWRKITVPHDLSISLGMSQAKRGWMGSVSASAGRSTPSTDPSSSLAHTQWSDSILPPSSFLARLQSSDTAAELSKVSTNWTAKAMDRWNAASRRSASESTSSVDGDHDPPSPTMSNTSNFSSRLGSLSSVGASFLRNKGRTFSISSNSSASKADVRGPPSASHPAVMTWNQSNRGQVPDFLLPDVMDSPDGRTEYAYIRPTSMMYNGNLEGASVSSPRTNGLRYSPGVSPLLLSGGDDSVIGSSTMERSIRRGIQGAVHGSVSEKWRFLGRNGVPMHTGPSISSGSSSCSTRIIGPKPLLLAGSARTAREPSEDGSLGKSHAPPASKVVRTGPLAGCGSPYSSRFPLNATPQRRRRERGGAASLQSSDGMAADTSSSHDHGFMHGHWLAPDHSPERSLGELPQFGRPATADEAKEELADDEELSAISAAANAARWQRTLDSDRAKRFDETAQNERFSGDNCGTASSMGSQARSLQSLTFLQEALQKAGAVPDLPSLRSAPAAVKSFGALKRTSEGVNSGGTTVQTKKMDIHSSDAALRTISAGAFGGKSTARDSVTDASAASGSEGSEDSEYSPRSQFGPVSSSSDVPLVSEEGIQVGRRVLLGSRTGSGGGVTGILRCSRMRKTSSTSTATAPADSLNFNYAGSFGSHEGLTGVACPGQNRSAVFFPAKRRLRISGSVVEDPNANSAKGTAIVIHDKLNKDIHLSDGSYSAPRKCSLTDEPVAVYDTGVNDIDAIGRFSSVDTSIDDGAFAQEGGTYVVPNTREASSPVHANSPSELIMTLFSPIIPPHCPEVPPKAVNIRKASAMRASSSSAHSVASSSGGGSVTSSRSGHRPTAAGVGPLSSADRSIVRSKRRFKTGSTHGGTNTRSSSRTSNSHGFALRLKVLDHSYFAGVNSDQSASAEQTFTASPMANSPPKEISHHHRLDYSILPFFPPLSAARMDENGSGEDEAGFGLSQGRQAPGLGVLNGDGAKLRSKGDPDAVAGAPRMALSSNADENDEGICSQYNSNADEAVPSSARSHQQTAFEERDFPPLPQYGESLYDGCVDRDNEDEAAIAAIGSAFEQFSAGVSICRDGDDDHDGGDAGPSRLYAGNYDDRHPKSVVDRQDLTHHTIVRDNAGGIKF